MNKESIKAAYDTSDSFYSSAEFGYHHKKGDYQCRIILEKRQRATDALLVNSNITKQQVEELINYIQKDTDIMISQLLTEATELRQKLRTQKAKLDTVISQLKSKVRSLSEENLQMTSELQMKQRIHKQEIKELRKYKKQKRTEICSLDKEMGGMQRLLSEYQNQLQKKEKQIVWMKKQLDEQSAFSQQAKIQITKQTAQIEQLKQQIYYFEREQQTQKIIHNTQQNDQIKSLLQKQRMLQEEVSDRECLIRCLNQEAASKNKEIDNLNLIVAKLRSELQNEKNSKAVQKNKQNSHILKLQSASEAAISSIKAKYNLKVQKIVQLVSRQLKKLRSQLQVIKTSVVKQMQLCYKQNKAIIKSELKTLYSK